VEKAKDRREVIKRIIKGINEKEQAVSVIKVSRWDR